MITVSTIMYRQNQVESLFKSLNLYFLPKNRVLKQVEVWERVIFLQFEKGSPQFFSKKQAAFISDIPIKRFNNLIGFSHKRPIKPKLDSYLVLSQQDKDLLQELTNYAISKKVGGQK